MSQNTRASSSERRFLASWRLLALIVLTACGDGPAAPDPEPLRPEQVNGNWTFQLTDTAGCGGEDFAHGTITARVALESEPPDIFAFVDRTRSTWSSNGVAGWISGWFAVSVPGPVVLNFVIGQPGAESDLVFQVLGTVSGGYELTGRAVDPVTGSVPTLSGSPCTYRIRGTRES